ncbi:MAG: formate dehydrogenase subunit alpha [Chromatiaceae bacterium]
MENAAYIDNEPFAIIPGETILEFVRRHRGRDLIPTLCQADNLENYGSCRLCSVEVAKSPDGPSRVLASCHTPVAPGQYLYPASERIRRLRRNILELVLSDYPTDRLQPAPGQLPTEFQRTLAALGIPAVRYPPGARHPAPAPDLGHPYLRADMAECIGCYRCVRACDELQAGQVLAVAGRGLAARVIVGADQSFTDSPCVACGACVQTCPTNALTDRYGTKTAPYDRLVRTICTYCGVGCNLEVKVRDGQIQGIQGAADAAVNRGHTCIKGRFAFEFHRHPDRLTTPLIRKDGQLQPATWDEALDYTARRFQEIKDRQGPDALAGISSARCTNEENYLMQKFFRVVIGTNNIDGCARVCHAPTALGMQWTLGTGAATNSVADLDQTACILLIGANPTAAHPVTGARIKTLVQRGVPLIVIDPLRTELARYAQYHLRPRPGTNLAVLNLFARAILDAGLIDEDFIARRTEGWEAFAAHLQGLDIAAQTRICGGAWDLIQASARAYATAPAAMEFHGLGVTEHWQGTKAVSLIAAIALMTGNLGKPGAGVNPLRGQNNVQGAADMGVQPHQGPGYLAVDDPQVQARYQDFYGVAYPNKPGYKIPEMFAASTRGDLKALWIMGEDLLRTDPNTCQVRHALSGLEFLVVQELFLTDTAQLADVVFPASSFFEKEGTFTNAERRVQRVRPVIPPLAGTRPDGQIVIELMQRLNYPQAAYSAPDLLREIAGLVPFFQGVRWEELGDQGKQWPVAADGTATPILHREAFKRGLGRFQVWDFEETAELAAHGADYPYILTTGRLLEHYNSGTMTRRTPNAELVGEDLLYVHPDDAHAKHLANGDAVRLRSPRAETVMRVALSDIVKPGVLYTTFHFPEASINHLTSDVGDEFTLTPEFKVVAVDFERASMEPGKPPACPGS